MKTDFFPKSPVIIRVSYLRSGRLLRISDPSLYILSALLWRLYPLCIPEWNDRPPEDWMYFPNGSDESHLLPWFRHLRLWHRQELTYTDRIQSRKSANGKFILSVLDHVLSAGISSDGIFWKLTDPVSFLWWHPESYRRFLRSWLIYGLSLIYRFRWHSLSHAPPSQDSLPEDRSYSILE